MFQWSADDKTSPDPGSHFLTLSFCDLLEAIVKTRTTRFSLAALMILSCCLSCCLPSVRAESKSRTNTDKVRSVLLWTPQELFDADPEAPELEVRIVDHPSPLQPRLQIFKNRKVLFTYDPAALALASVFQLQDGNLGTIWHTGCGGDGDTHFIVFAYLKGKVHQALDAVSGRGMYPEFVYQQKGHLMGFPEPAVNNHVVSHGTVSAIIPIKQ
jgi:hypothetical protein